MTLVREVLPGGYVEGVTEFTFRKTLSNKNPFSIAFWTAWRGDEVVLLSSEGEARLWRFILEDMGHTVIWEIE
jgi:hypothetical protein